MGLGTLEGEHIQRFNVVALWRSQEEHLILIETDRRYSIGSASGDARKLSSPDDFTHPLSCRR